MKNITDQVLADLLKSGSSMLFEDDYLNEYWLLNLLYIIAYSSFEVNLIKCPSVPYFGYCAL